eukprot:CAMPEP_0179269304 /NCGR_PEP_ID=MMETSP0797-20121207/30889_1 /TAXON_ID=47934 /ORGANISM="Dinophysis acuminata, Strain DAEP01" /LENGTH=260 /DNA_ID=CAMNT_0020977617 /DNA_START=101 /DNA_END=880 /DNA_ORIENTATION=+
MKHICRAFSGKQLQALQADEEEMASSLLSSKNFVHDLGTAGCCVDSERVNGPMGNGIEALATPPMELTGKLPETHEPGKSIKIPGPHGPIEVTPPNDAQPGTTLRYRLAPPHEFRIEVPPGAQPGLQAKFRKQNGVEICVPVPPGLKPGDTFEVLPPALMVRVPECVKEGDFVVFRHTMNEGGGMEVTEWCRARVPPGHEPGAYFAARIPMPLDAGGPPIQGNGMMQAPEYRLSGGRTQARVEDCTHWALVVPAVAAAAA